ncbi:phosphatase PAP2 family protein [Erysipelothrix amsterdamensis]|uniref:Phosphatase PAP2 family protein n=2 Tax=Erysipelothrix amsterdamensis TaxID=2929157 RepID=A0AAU9VI14_9FIRM|nr:phosphatase PAP2 family protein [Erysipelothrix sp. A18Y020d]CAH2760762.1 phosphatase PAP2 family protein [Erysipelothrix sp. A18Y020d]
MLDRFFALFTSLGDHGEIWFIILLILFVMKKTRKVAILGLLAISIEVVLISGIIKPIVMRPRPFYANPVDLIIPVPRGSSFPSGHAASSFAVAMVLYFNNIKHKPIYISLAILMAFSRLYAYVHYPSDVLVGTVLGIFIAYEVTKYQDVLLKIMNSILVRIGIKKEIAP